MGRQLHNLTSLSRHVLCRAFSIAIWYVSSDCRNLVSFRDIKVMRGCSQAKESKLM